MIVPSILVASQQTQVTVTCFVSGADSETQVQIFNLAGGTPVLIGTMTDDGQNGDQTAGDQVYTIVTNLTPPAASSLPLQVVATTGTAGTESANLPVQLVQIPSYTSNSDLNQAESQIYSTAIQARTSFSSPTWSSSTLLPAMRSNLVSMYGQFTGVVNQNADLQSSTTIIKKTASANPQSNDPRANGILGSILNVLTFGLLAPAQNASSCNELLQSLGGFRGDATVPVLSLDDPGLQQFAQELATICSTASSCQGAFSVSDFQSGNLAAAEWAQEYIVSGQPLPTSIDGCGGGVTQSVDNVAVTSEVGQFTDLAGDGLTSLAGGGQISQQLTGYANDILVGTVVDSSGSSTLVIGQVGANQTLPAPTGTYNLAASFGGDTANATITKTPVYPNSITYISPLPGIILWLDPPEIQSFSPTSGPVGTPVTLSGYGFNPPSGSLTSINFNGVNATVSSATDSSMTVVVPPGATTGPITVLTTVGETMSSISFTVTTSTGNPVPTITGLNPSSLAVGAAPQTLTINGTGFLTSSAITYNGIAHAVAYLSGNQLMISLTSSDLATAGTYPVVVTNPAPGGGSSVAVDFTVSSTNPVPAINSLSPASLTVGAPPQALTINGTGFLTSSTVSLNGAAHTVTYVGSSQLTISLTSADLATAGIYPVVVTNPAPGGGTSTAANFTVTNPQIANEWTWINGSSTVGALGVYGTLGVPSASNVPGSRYGASSWIDSSGTFWLFGGYGYASTGSLDSLNDLWMFSPITGNWTWVSGSNTVSAPAVYGSQGVPATTNVPGARMYSISWIDKNSKLWLFGGEGVGSNNVSGFLDDLWEFDPVANAWIWVSGNSASDAPGVYGTLGQPSVSNVPGSRYRSVSWIDSKGNLWLFGGDGEDSTGFYGQLNDLWEYSPSANTWTWVSGGNTANEDGVYGTVGIPATTNIPGSRRQAASWIDGSDNLWLFGGSGWNASGSAGGAPLNDLWEFNPTVKTWTWISGSSTLYTPNNTYSAIGVYGTEGAAAAGNTPGGRTNPVSWIDSSNNLWLFGGNGFDSTATVGELNDLWEFNPSTSEWTWVSGSNTANAIGAYGAHNVPTAANVPGSRDYPVGWIDDSGNLWLFGGEGYGSTKTFNLLNDLWRYQPSDTAAPSITGVSPTTFTAPLLGQTITIDGSGFQSDDTLTFAPPTGSAIPSTPGNLTYNSRSQLSYQFNDSIFVGGQGLGTWTVTVTNPSGQASNAWNFTTVCELCEANP
jgi:N-acetylneuraminic acid mutarotase